MANFEEKTRTYETLIRHNADGTVAAHHQTINEVLKDGVVISATVNSPVALINVQSELEPILSSAFILIVSDNEKLKAQVEEKDSEISKLSREISELKKQLSAVE